MATRQTALSASMLPRCMLATCMLAAVFSVGAHESPIPGTCTAIGARQVTIGSFRFTEKALIREREQHTPSTCPLAGNGPNREVATPLEGSAASNSRISPGGSPDTGPAGKCGVVDDYHIGMMSIIKYCNDPKLGNGQASFRVARPASYSARTHHKSYRFSDGDLIGTCYICIVKRPINIGPAHPAVVKPQD